MKRLLIAAAAAVSLLFGGAAFASTVDVVDPLGEGPDKIDWKDGLVKWTHDLGDALNSAIVESGTIEIVLYDDGSIWDGDETVRIIVGTIDFFDGAIAWDVSDLGNYWDNLGANSINMLNEDGVLHVALWSAMDCDNFFCMPGDFYLGTSTLTLVTREVPVPGTLALFGLGLVALGAIRHRKSA
jgi:hypothetical protein